MGFPQKVQCSYAVTGNPAGEDMQLGGYWEFLLKRTCGWAVRQLMGIPSRVQCGWAVGQLLGMPQY